MEDFDDYAHLDRFRERLTSPKRWQAIIADIRQLREESADNDGDWLDGGTYSEAPVSGRIPFDLHRAFSYFDLEEVLRKHLLADYEFPPITIDELVRIGKAQLAGADTDEDFQKAIERFVAFVDEETYYSVDDSTLGEEIDFRVIGSIDHPKVVEFQKECATLWVSPFGFVVNFGFYESIFSPLKFNASGKFSSGAMEQVDEVLRRTIRSASNSLILLHCDFNEDRSYRDIPFDADDTAIGNDIALLNRGFFAQLLNYYFIPQAKKSSTFDQRMRNAMHLLVEADEQKNRGTCLPGDQRQGERQRRGAC